MEGIREIITRFPRKRDVLFIPPVIAFFIYHGLLKAHFSVIDDPVLLEYLPTLKIGEIFSVDKNAPWFRPFLDISFLIDYKIWALDPFGYHLTNILLHSFNTILVAFLSLTLIEGNRITALLASLLFAVHPVNLECVAWISARADLLSTSAIISSFIFFSLYFKNGSKKSHYLILSAAVYLSALLIKETAIIFIPVIISYVFFYSKTPLKPKMLRFLPALLIYLFSTAVYFIIKSRSMPGAGKSGVIPELYYLHMVAPFADDPDLPTAIFHALIPILNLIGALGFYVKKLLFPYPLNMYIFSINEDAYILVCLTVFILIITFFKKRRTPNFLFFTFFLCLAPAAPIAFINIVWTHYSERYLYLPGTFFMICAAYGITTLSLKAGRMKPWVTGPALLVLFLFSSATITLGEMWQNTVTLSRYLIKKNPEQARPHEILGTFHFSEGRFKEAKKRLQEAVKLGATNIPYYYLGLIAFKEGEEEKGVSLLKKSAKGMGPNMDYFKKIGDYYLAKSAQAASHETGFLNDALKYYEASYRNVPGNPAILYRLSMVNYKTGEFKAANKYAKELSSLFPDSVMADAAQKYAQ